MKAVNLFTVGQAEWGYPCHNAGLVAQFKLLVVGRPVADPVYAAYVGRAERARRLS